MRSLVYQNAAAFAAPGCTPVALAVVAVRTPPGIDDPAGTTDLSQFTRCHQLFYLLIQLIGSLVEHDAESHIRMGCRTLVHLTYCLCVNAGRLLYQNIHPVLQAVDGNLCMEIMRNRGNHCIYIAGINHILPVCIERNLRIFFLAHSLFGRIRITQRA